MGFAFPIDNGCWVQGSMGHLQCCLTAAERPYTWLMSPLLCRHSQTVLGTFLSNEGEGYFELLTTDRLVSFLRIVTEVCVCMWTKFPFNFSEEGTN